MKHFIEKLFIVFFILVYGTITAQIDLHVPIEGNYGNEFIIVNHVDWGENDEILDYQCGNKTYNGHQGTDFVIRSFSMMDDGVFVVAALDGVVTYIKDGLFDREKKSDLSKGLGNYIAISHKDGYYTYYGHLALNSILVNIGDTVKAGDRIAKVGSSGNSSDPHLHFEVWKDSIYVIDPFMGNCGNPSSLWQNAPTYDTSFNIWQSGLTDFIPYLDTLREEPKLIHTFEQNNEAIAYWSILYGLRKGDTLTTNWITPEGTLWFSYHYEVPNDAWYFYYWTYINVPIVQHKSEKWLVQFNRNRTFIDELQFSVNGTTSISEIESDNKITLFPNPIKSSSTLQWKSSESGHTTIDILDVYGKTVKELVNDKRYHGEQFIHFDISDLPMGIYFIQMKIDNNITTKRILKLD